MTLGQLIALGAGSAVCALALATRRPRVQRWDDALERWMTAHRDGVHDIASIATLPGERLVHPLLGAMAAVVLIAARGGDAQRFLIPLAGASLGGIVAHHLVKFVYRRPRPEGALRRNKTEPAYPSGHTTNATAVLTTAAYLLAREGLVPLPLGALCVVAVVAITGASRVALGWHWGTDVLGGWLTGLAVAAGCGMLYEVLALG